MLTLAALTRFMSYGLVSPLWGAITPKKLFAQDESPLALTFFLIETQLVGVLLGRFQATSWRSMETCKFVKYVNYGKKIKITG